MYISQPVEVTICLNSMHSQKALAEHYPGLEVILPLYYGQASISSDIYEDLNFEALDSVDFEKLMRNTSSTYWIQVKAFIQNDFIMSFFLSKKTLSKNYFFMF